MADCLFCKIAAKELDSEIVHETDNTIAFKDINPAASTHVLVIPKRHIGSSHELGSSDGALLGELFDAIAAVASNAGVEEGYRLVTNIGADAGQSVNHVHFHVLGGRSMSWPPG
jgi:histidine triad (HIT) family protein